MVKPVSIDQEIDRVVKQLAGRVAGHDNDQPVSMSISLPMSMIQKLEAKRLHNKLTSDGPKTLSGLIRESLAKDGYGS